MLRQSIRAAPLGRKIIVISVPDQSSICIFGIAPGGLARLAIVRGISAENPAHYRVLITSGLPSEDERSGNRSLMVASRIQTMHAESDANLVRFLDAYGRLQAYLLVPAIMREGGSPQFLLELAIQERKLSVKNASEVGEHEIETMALGPE